MLDNISSAPGLQQLVRVPSSALNVFMNVFLSNNDPSAYGSGFWLLYVIN